METFSTSNLILCHTFMFLLSTIFQKVVEVEVTGNVDDVHPIEEELADGHHLHQGDGEVRGWVHAGVVEDEPRSVNASSSILVVDEGCNIEDAVN